MPWNSSSLVEQRHRFVLEALREREPFAALCRRHRLARSCGYKWLARFRESGVRGLLDRPRTPARSPRRLAPRWQTALRRLRARRPTWGPKKLRRQLQVEHPRARLPSARTLGRWLRRWCLNRPPRRRARSGPPLRRPGRTVPQAPHDVWTVDFKGWFRTRDGTRVEPLTVRDAASRFLLCCRLLPSQADEPVRRVFRRLFGRHGLPRAIRCDNGAPFGGCGPRGLSRLSVWWRRLGIRVEFGWRAHPEDNAAHEQMHAVYQREVAALPAANPAAQQRRTDRWRRRFNHERPHEALALRTPAAAYRANRRQLPRRLPRWRYPHGWPMRTPNRRGYVRWQGRSRFLGRAFAGERLGFRPLTQRRWAVHLGPDLLGHLHAADTHDGLRPVRLTPQHA